MGATRAVELLFCIVNIAVLANSNFASAAAQAYLIVMTVALLLYALLPFSIADFLVRLRASGSEAEEQDQAEGFLDKMDTFQRQKPGAHCLFACDAVSMMVVA